MIIQQCNGEGDKEMSYMYSIEAFYDRAVFLMHEHGHDQANIACSLFSRDMFGKCGDSRYTKNILNTGRWRLLRTTE